MTAFYHETLAGGHIMQAKHHRTRARHFQQAGNPLDAERHRIKAGIHLKIARAIRKHPREMACRVCNGDQRVGGDIPCWNCCP